MVSSLGFLSASDTNGDTFNTGPIIRISPHEIHIDDPDFFDKLNSFQGKWNKDPYTAHQFANPGSSVGTIDHDLHRKRRMAVLPFFSKTKIYALEPVIQSTIDRLCNRMEDYVKSGQPLNLRNAYKCFAADVVAEYCFAESGGLLEKPDFSLAHWKEHQQGLKAGLRARYLPAWYLPVVRGAPEWIRATVDPAAKHFEVWHRVSLTFPDTKRALTDQLGCGWASSSHGRQEERRLLRKGRPSNHLP
jgi:Cytochrome P450